MNAKKPIQFFTFGLTCVILFQLHSIQAERKRRQRYQTVARPRGSGFLLPQRARYLRTGPAVNATGDRLVLGPVNFYRK